MLPEAAESGVCDCRLGTVGKPTCWARQGDCRSGSVWKMPAHRLMLPPNAWGGSLVAKNNGSLPELRELRHGGGHVWAALPP